MKRLQFLIDLSLVSSDAWSQESIEYREKLRAEIAQLRGK